MKYAWRFAHGLSWLVIEILALADSVMRIPWFLGLSMVCRDWETGVGGVSAKVYDFYVKSDRRGWNVDD